MIEPHDTIFSTAKNVKMRPFMLFLAIPTTGTKAKT